MVSPRDNLLAVAARRVRHDNSTRSKLKSSCEHVPINGNVRVARTATTRCVVQLLCVSSRQNVSFFRKNYDYRNFSFIRLKQNLAFDVKLLIFIKVCHFFRYFDPFPFDACLSIFWCCHFSFALCTR